jgi:hypothetical protein
MRRYSITNVFKNWYGRCGYKADTAKPYSIVEFRRAPASSSICIMALFLLEVAIISAVRPRCDHAV